MAAAAAAAAVDFNATDQLIKEILGPNRDGEGGQLHTLGQRVNTGNTILIELTRRVADAHKMINMLQTTQAQLEEGQGQVKEDLDNQRLVGEEELQTLRTALEQAKQTTAATEKRLAAAQRQLEGAQAVGVRVTGEAAEREAAAAREAATVVVRQEQVNVANAKEESMKAQQALRDANRAIQEQLGKLQQRYIAVTQALETINRLLTEKNDQLDEVLQKLQQKAREIPTDPPPVPSFDYVKPGQHHVDCGNWGKALSGCRDANYPCYYNYTNPTRGKEYSKGLGKCFKPRSKPTKPLLGWWNLGKNFNHVHHANQESGTELQSAPTHTDITSWATPPPPSSSQHTSAVEMGPLNVPMTAATGGMRGRKKSRKARKHHKTRKCKGGWQVTKKSRKSRKSNRRHRHHGTRKRK